MAQQRGVATLHRVHPRNRGIVPVLLKLEYQTLHHPLGSKPSQISWLFFEVGSNETRKAETSEDVDSLLVVCEENDPNPNSAHHKQFQSNCYLLELNDTVSAVGPIHKQTPKKNGMKEDKLMMHSLSPFYKVAQFMINIVLCINNE